jgi:acyl-homoserine lactone acylase PvdQ
MRTAAAVTAALATTAAVATTASAKDYSDTARSILAPGQAGGLPTTPNSTDQLALYDALTPLRGNVTAADVNKYYKPNVFGTAGQGPTKVEKTSNKSVKIVRDKWGVPHITAKKRGDVIYGSGYVAAQDRQLLLELARGPGRLAILDAPGIDAFSLIVGGKTFVPSSQADALISKQLTVLKQAGAKGKQTLQDIDDYVRGINGFYKDSGQLGNGAGKVKPWTRADELALQGFIGSIFGRGGGNEAANAEFLSALNAKLGAAKGHQVFEDLRETDDPEAPVSSPNKATYNTVPSNASGNAVVDAGSFKGVSFGKDVAKPAEKRYMSNALLIGAKRSTTGHPIFLAGPQLGYYYPEIVLEEDLHGGGIDARGIATPGAGPYVFIGRGPDFAWSLTSAGNDIIDQYVETLCGDDTHYMYKGKCTVMKRTNVGTLKGTGGAADQQISYSETVHGPVVGYATSNGKRVAITTKRSTRLREASSLLFFNDLDSGRVKSAKTFLKSVAQFEHTFNVFYADDKDIAYYSSGRLPIRPKNVDPGLPAKGDGTEEWTGYVSSKNHPQVVNPKSGEILNWNNKPAHGFGSADDEWGYGPVHRVELFYPGIDKLKKHKPETVVSAMNAAATQDLREELILPDVNKALEGSTAPQARDKQLLDILNSWSSKGGDRLDADLDGKVDAPGAAIMDAWWPKLTDAVMSPVLGDLTDALADVSGRGGSASSGGSSFGGGWWNYLDKDLRTITGQKVDGKYSVKFCGNGVLAGCQASLWKSLDDTFADLSATQGNDPNLWRADATKERIKFQPGLIPQTTMRWTNRPTYQQIDSFNGHR